MADTSWQENPIASEESLINISDENKRQLMISNAIQGISQEEIDQLLRKFSNPSNAIEYHYDKTLLYDEFKELHQQTNQGENITLDEYLLKTLEEIKAEIIKMKEQLDSV